MTKCQPCPNSSFFNSEKQDDHNGTNYNDMKPHYVEHFLQAQQPMLIKSIGINDNHNATKIRSTKMAQVMDCHLTAPSHYVEQY